MIIIKIIISYFIFFLTSCGSGGFGRRRLHIAIVTVITIDVAITPPAAINVAIIIIVDCFSSY